MPVKKKNSYLYFSKKEKTGSIFLLIIIVVLTAIPFLYSIFVKDKIFNRAQYANELNQLESKKKDSNRTFTKYPPYDKSKRKNDWPKYNKNQTGYQKSERFTFDPNTLDIKDWQRMGVSEKTATTIQRYIEKGGRFREPSDLKKIWGLRPSLAEELLPYVQIASSNASNAYQKTAYPEYEKKIWKPREIKPVEINGADSLSWEALPGIGPSLTRRIMDYKRKLGGFYSVAQVKEIYGLPDSSYQKILPYLKLDSAEIKMININKASLEDLKTHPYIRYHIANAIVEYRTQHGPFSSVASLKKIMLITDELLMKMAPYLRVN